MDREPSHVAPQEPAPTSVVILNLRAGQAGRRARELVTALRERPGTTVVQTDDAEAGRRAARDAARHGAALVVAAGGDGTVRSTVAGLLAVEPSARPQLGIVPLGRGNDLAAAYGFRLDERAIASLPDRCAVRPLDVGVVHLTTADGQADDGAPPGCEEISRAEPFVNSLGIGLEGGIARRAARVPLPGLAPYLLAALAEIVVGPRPARAQGHADGTALDERIVALSVGNGPTTGGGFRLTPGADPGDGALDWALLRATRRAGLLAILPRALRGRHVGDPRVVTGRATRLGLELDPPLPVHADGDLLSAAARRVVIRLEAGAIAVRIPGP